ncbi:glycosyltransferase [Leptolyngbya sp. FACHB-671]|uniref:glycosyltransferase n=1 Tax=Leptolyngbya sp. FACHB-671 TaxID=2692812 RepID=UPI0016895262|nr:glycosyltransferase [Leptolyngbya sp. FACHB-671]
MNVSIVIAAHNAAGTIAETLNSLLCQTYLDWEAIIVDDGSSDETAAIAAQFTAKDARIQVVSQPQGGVSSARNRGVSLAQSNWLLFLDADDWLLPPCLELLTNVLKLNAEVDAVYCGWARVAPDGRYIDQYCCPCSDNLFEVFAKYCAFAIHTCIFRHSLFESVGGFNPSLKTCEDWDLWQRIARTGASFAAVYKVLALYRMRPDSASMSSFQVFTDGLQVITQGHSTDPRISNPDPNYQNGLPTDQLSSTKYYFACWIAGLMIGSGSDARSLLEVLKDEPAPELDPQNIVQNLFLASLLPTCQTPSEWNKLWATIQAQVNNFLLALEEQTQISGLHHDVYTALEQHCSEPLAIPERMETKVSHTIQLEITEPIPNLSLPEGVERLHCTIELEGTCLGTLELPVFEGYVHSYVLTDAIAADFAWQIIGHFFEHTVYPSLSIETQETRSSIRRGNLCLAELPSEQPIVWSKIHNQIGWTVFLQEIWARPDLPEASFYDPQAPEEASTKCCLSDGWLTLEVSGTLSDVKVAGQQLDVVLTVGGVAIGVVPVPVKDDVVRSQELRAALTAATGYELCCTAVREGLLGRPVTEPTSLRDRLLEAASHNSPTDALNRVLSPSERGVVLGRRTFNVFGTSASRRAVFPATVARELSDCALMAGEPVLHVLEPSEQAARVVYAPDLIWRPVQKQKTSSTHTFRSNTKQAVEVPLYNRSYFETTFATGPVHWNYTNQYEQTKYEQTLSLLPPKPIARVLELACAEGHFTAQLAPHVEHLTAADISQIALEQAAERCAGLKNVDFMHLDFMKEPLPKPFDLIICSEVLYFANERETLQNVAQKFADALAPGGYLLTAHANLVIDEPDRPGFNWNFPFGAKVIGEILASTPSLHLVREIWTPLYRIQLFQRSPQFRWFFSQTAPELIKLPQPTPPPPQVAADVLWNGGTPRDQTVQSVSTYHLPILMYHRVAPSGASESARYRVSPDAFEEQVRYLYDAGYYSITLEDWHAAMKAHRPLPGRAIMFTFDDGYQDFQTYAWPILKQYEFTAIVFLVANLVGKTNLWDQAYGEEIPLLEWQQIRQLESEGVEFGSHSANHHPLTTIPYEAVIREGICSRMILERELGHLVKTFAYPHGAEDRVIQHLIGACGYSFGLSCRSGLCGLQEPLLALPRIEITGSDKLRDFVAKLNP